MFYIFLFGLFDRVVKGHGLDVLSGFFGSGRLRVDGSREQQWGGDKGEELLPPSHGGLSLPHTDLSFPHSRWSERRATDVGRWASGD